ncbi:hypothetical protein Hanom_Chr11g00968061 [Helianthus anomalus]
MLWGVPLETTGVSGNKHLCFVAVRGDGRKQLFCSFGKSFPIRFAGQADQKDSSTGGCVFDLA